MKKIPILIKLLAIFAISFVLLYLFPRNEDSKFVEIIFATSSFIFGIIIAFSIANRHSRLSSIREFLRKQDAVFREIYLLSKDFDKKVSNKIRDKIEDILTAQIDYKLIDFDKVDSKKIDNLFIFIEKLNTRFREQEELQKKMLDGLSELLKIQKEINYQIKNKMLNYEWITLVGLYIIMFFCLFYINAGSVSSILMISFLTASLGLLLIVLKELDSLEWQEQDWIWEPLSTLFIEIGLLPYFPEEIFKRGRLNLKGIRHLKEIRIAHYPNPYPDMRRKSIEIIKI
ncbi:hypothetical protein HYW76_05385 [Candidatus Pacearchaeota archaeon]|nr:hypothetical protein [Candidatus Pacearchaeota archaeon]